MMDRFSPNARRAIAVAILIVAMLSALNLLVLPLASALAESLDSLQFARSRRARLETIAQAPPVPVGQRVPAEAVLRAETPDKASAQLIRYVIALGSAHQMTVEAVATPNPLSPASNLTTISLSATGTEMSMISFLDAVENGSPAVRFRDISLAAPDEAEMPMHLEGRLSAVWAPR